MSMEPEGHPNREPKSGLRKAATFIKNITRRNRSTQPPEESSNMVTDPELARLLISGQDALGEQGLDTFLRAQQRFNKPSIITEPDGSQRRDDNYFTKLVLGEIPSYVTTARTAGLASDQIGNLLLHTVSASKSEATERNELNVALLTRALQTSIDKNEVVTGEDVQRIETMITLGASDGVIPHSLRAYEVSRKTGLSLDEGTKLVSDFLQAKFPLSARSSISHFIPALNTLNIAHVD